MRSIGRAALVAALTLCLTSSVGAIPGDLDPAFGVDGFAVASFKDGGQGFAGALAADGTFVVAGHSGQRLAVARFMPDGSMDPAFGGGDGKALFTVGEGYAQAHDVLVAADGRVLISAFGVRGGRAAFHLVRLLPDGSRDRSFGAEGIVTTAFDAGPATAWGVALQPDGNVVVAGSVGPMAAVARYLPNGSLDQSFGEGGVALFAVGMPAADSGVDVAPAPSGDVVVVGTSDDGAGIFTGRLDPNGSFDAGFGGDGWSIARGLGDDVSAAAVAVRPNGQVVVGGTRTPAGAPCCEMVLIVYGVGGGRIAGFGGGDGIQSLRPDGGWAFVSAIALGPGGSVVAVGGGGALERRDVVVARVGSDGTPDPAFGGGDGIAVVWRDGEEAGYGLGLEADGDVMVAGTRYASGIYRFLGARVRGG